MTMTLLQLMMEKGLIKQSEFEEALARNRETALDPSGDFKLQHLTELLESSSESDEVADGKE